MPLVLKIAERIASILSPASMETETDPRGVVDCGMTPLKAASADGLVVAAVTGADDVTRGVPLVNVGEVTSTSFRLSLFVMMICATWGVASISVARRVSSVTFSE